ncbi:alpha/beta-hydrolase [Rhizodiscina lignyota]|uniref:Alpha/beta-hydrolase n=1 Tax=Rhizodiscina lignyota TaxID=1504668 RepID=A0A9P4M758_9PEZI|nr:alpha/beta-hydrolase [Rhizodiscina lignyota]
MAIDRIDMFSDPRVEHKTANLNGHTYHYVLGEPKEAVKGTIFLIHGWPDCAAGWRYQIPALIELGFRVVVPDLMGFAGTDAPKVPPNSISLYSHKRAADDFEELARQLGVSNIILGGHDWGGSVVWRMALWKPDLVTHVFSVCTPYTPPQKDYVSLEDLVKGPLPQFAYQLHLASPEVEGRIQSKEDIRQFLKGMFGGRGPNGELVFEAEKGILFDSLPKLGDTPLMTPKELDYYVEQYSRNGLHGTMNWYRTRKVNWEEELQLNKTTIDQPSLFIQATRDLVLKPEMARGMQKYMTHFSYGEVEATHWALVQKPQEVNAIITQWLNEVVLGGRSKL